MREMDRRGEWKVWDTGRTLIDVGKIAAEAANGFEDCGSILLLISHELLMGGRAAIDPTCMDRRAL